MSDMVTQITLRGLERFKRGERVDTRKHYARGIAIFERYVETSEHNLAYLVAWVMHTYWLGITGFTQYLSLVGKPATGKTQCTKLVADLAFKGVFAHNPTPATIFRLVEQSQCTLMCDELEKTKKDALAEVVGLFNSGYSRGSWVLRCEECSGKQVVKKFSAFSAKGYNANQELSSDAFRTRTHEITMLPARRKLGDLEAKSDNELREIEDWRDDCWLLALQEWKTYEAEYARLRGLEELSSRARYIYLPVLAAYGVMGGDMPALQIALIADREAVDAEVAGQDWDAIVLEVVFGHCGSGLKSGPVGLKDVAAEVTQRLQAEGDMPADRTFTPHRLGGTLRKLGIKPEEAPRDGNARRVVFDRANVLETAQRFPGLARRTPELAAAALPLQPLQPHQNEGVGSTSSAEPDEKASSLPLKQSGESGANGEVAGKVRVRLLDNAPQFIIKEGTFGPFDKNGEAILPQTVAELLVSQGIARLVQGNASAASEPL